MGWSITLFLLVDGALIAALLLLTPVFFEAIANRIPEALVGSWLLGLSLAVGVAEAAASGVYVVGFSDVYGSRAHRGPRHARFVRRSFYYLCIAAALVVGGYIVPSFTGPLLGVPGVTRSLPAWALSVSVIVPGLRALFAALALVFAVGELASRSQEARLLVGMILGVIGAVAWPGAIAYAVASGGTPEGPVTALVAGVVAGLGTSVISLLLFAETLREVRAGLEGPPQVPS